MTRKDCELIADTIAGLTTRAARAAAAMAFATALAQGNPRFNRALFMKACQVEQ